jgi:hypothetical protein
MFMSTLQLQVPAHLRIKSCWRKVMASKHGRKFSIALI